MQLQYGLRGRVQSESATTTTRPRRRPGLPVRRPPGHGQRGGGAGVSIRPRQSGRQHSGLGLGTDRLRSLSRRHMLVSASVWTPELWSRQSRGTDVALDLRLDPGLEKLVLVLECRSRWFGVVSRRRTSGLPVRRARGHGRHCQLQPGRDGLGPAGSVLRPRAARAAAVRRPRVGDARSVRVERRGNQDRLPRQVRVRRQTAAGQTYVGTASQRLNKYFKNV